MKKLIIIVLACFFVYLIYYLLYNNKINYVLITDNYLNSDSNDYIKSYLTKKDKLNNYNIFINNSASKVYKDILNNRTIRINNNDYYMKKVLRESDLVVISIGMKELANSFSESDLGANNRLFSKIYLDIKKLVIEIKKYAKGKIVFFGLYNPTSYYDARVDEFFYNVNNKLNRLMNNYNVVYIDLYNLSKENQNRDSLNKNIISILKNTCKY